MLGESRDALYIAFMGTKQRRDIIANARIGMAPLWPNDFPANEVICHWYPQSRNSTLLDVLPIADNMHGHGAQQIALPQNRQFLAGK